MKKTKTIWIYSLLILGVLVIFTTGCHNNDPVPPLSPVLTTAFASEIELTTALSGGTITSEGGAPISARGVCWSTSTAPTIADSKTTDGAGTGSFTSDITGLTSSTTYYVRAYATNSGGTAYGNESNFKTFGVIDIDGNKYHSVVIGAQEWMSENLKTITYSDGSPIFPDITPGGDWGDLTTGATTVYNNDPGNEAIYGRLYNWYAVTDPRQLAPEGWHIPTNDEWDVLATTLGGADIAGGKMKAIGTFQPGDGLWYAPNTGATNSSGFNGLPCGQISDNNGNLPFIFIDLHSYGHWWTADGDSNGATFRWIQDTHTILETSGNYSRNGKSVRCVKD